MECDEILSKIGDMNVQGRSEGQQRVCTIDDASIEIASGAGDGAYDLLGETGTAEHIGKAIADSLSVIDLLRGAQHSMLEAGNDLYLNVRIKITLKDQMGTATCR